MIVNAPGRTGTAATGTQADRSTGTASKADFLRLLTEQLRHQDPLKPMEDKDMMAQLAQFSALEETQKMNATLNRLTAGDQMAQGAAFLGKQVTGALPPSFDPYGNPVAGKTVSGVVESVTFRNGEVFLKLGNTEIPISAATTVEAGH